MKQKNIAGRRLSAEISAQPVRIAFVQSCWHRDIVDQSRLSFLRNIEQQGFARKHVECFEVPGAFEIPLYAKILAQTGRYAAVVAASVIDGLMSVQCEALLERVAFAFSCLLLARGSR